MLYAGGATRSPGRVSFQVVPGAGAHTAAGPHHFSPLRVQADSPRDSSLSLPELRARLDAALAGGLADDPIVHAGQVAAVAGVLHHAFALDGLRCVLTGGPALEVHVPGVYKSADLDVVVEGGLGEPVRARLAPTFEALGFQRVSRHWARGDLFVEVPDTQVDGPTEVLAAGGLTLQVLRVEALLKFRLVGFRYWGVTGYAQQAIDVLAALGDDYDEALLLDLLRAEGAEDAYYALLPLARSDAPVTDAGLASILAALTAASRKPTGSPVPPDP